MNASKPWMNVDCIGAMNEWRLYWGHEWMSIVLGPWMNVDCIGATWMNVDCIGVMNECRLYCGHEWVSIVYGAMNVDCIGAMNECLLYWGHEWMSIVLGPWMNVDGRVIDWYSPIWNYARYQENKVCVLKRKQCHTVIRADRNCEIIVWYRTK